MPTFLLGAALVGLVCFLGLIRPLLSGRSAAPSERRAVLAVYRQRLRELDEQREAGQLAERDHTSAKAEIEAQLASELGQLDARAAPARTGPAWLSALVLVVAAPLAALGVYQQTGGYAVALAAAEAASRQAAQRGPVERLAEKLRGRLDDVEGWWLLGRSWMQLDEPAEAVAALAQAYSVAEPNPELAFDYARALADLQENRLGGAPAVIIERELARFPDDSRLIWLGAMLALEEGRRGEALARFDRLVTSLPADSEDIERLTTMRERIAAGMGGPASGDGEGAGEAGRSEGTRAAGALTNAGTAGGASAAATTGPAMAVPAMTMNDRGSPAVTDGDTGGPRPAAATGALSTGPMAAGGMPSPSADATGAAVKVTVTLSPALAAAASPEAAVFVFAKAIEGPPMPLAVARAQVKDLPLEVTLDDRLAMAPAFRLSSAAEVAIGARISRTGQATAASGDIDGYAAEPVDPHAPGAKARVVLEHLVP